MTSCLPAWRMSTQNGIVSSRKEFALMGASSVLYENVYPKWDLFFKERICSDGSKFCPLRDDSNLYGRQQMKMTELLPLGEYPFISIKCNLKVENKSKIYWYDLFVVLKTRHGLRTKPV